MSDKTVTDAQYLSSLTDSPYVLRASRLVRVEGKSNLKGSWIRALASRGPKAS